MAILSTDFQNEIINETINTKRKYFMTDNDDGTVSFTDNTSYTQVGTEYGAEEIIEEREQINQHTNVIGSDEFNPESSYSAGDYFIYNNKLCKALSAISAGAALSLGSNYQVTSIKDELSGLNGNNAGAHNAIYRGKYLGSSVTETQWDAISAGTFDDLYVGDYWTIGGVNWRIAAFDYYYNCGDTNFTKHHVVIVPDTALYTHAMNDANITTGAYVGSKMYTEGLEQSKTKINNAFGSSHVLSHRIYLSNATSNGCASAGAWADSTVDLMCEHMVYGSGIFSPVSDGSTVPNNYCIEKSQLPLFAHNPRMIAIRSTWWLRDVISSAHFANVSYYGNAGYSYASSAHGVRPAFCIGI